MSSEGSPSEILRYEERHSIHDFCGQNPPAHSYLFGSDNVSVDAFEKVLILSVPIVPQHSKCTTASSAGSLNCLKQGSCHLKISAEDDKDLTLQDTDIGKITSPARCIRRETLPTSGLFSSDAPKENTLKWVENSPETPILNGAISDGGVSTSESPNVAKIKAPLLVPDECGNDFIDIELSLRLTNLIKRGFVPESPIADRGLFSSPDACVIVF